VPLAVLRAAPYDLVFGDSVDVQVAAINEYGSSGYSSVGYGALIQLVPDAPVDLADAVLITSATVIGFTWLDDTSNGGAAIIDYRIYYDQSTSTWVELDTGITPKSYQTTIALSQGHTYAFKVQARNSVGYSLFS
jgi:hypothetical protein